MTDLHTHILCGVDDGAKTPEDSLKMLRMERDQDVDTVVLTPHFLRDQMQPEEFFSRRQAAFDMLRTYLDKTDEPLPRMLLGAEVAWRPNMATWDGLEQLCIQGTRNLLLELPFGKWDANLCRQLHDLMNHTGITPVLVHMERYIKGQSRSQVLEILSLGLPVQINSSTFLRLPTRRESLKALKNFWVHVVASDCHNTENRPPDLGDAMKVIAAKLGDDAVGRLDRFSDSLCE